MEYDIIKKVAQLASSGTDSGADLNGAAGVILEASRFDQCAVYVWDEEKRNFFLKASAGAGTAAGCYGESEGIPGLVKETMAPVHFTGALPGGRTDPGLTGFGYAYALPMDIQGSFYGVLYLKSKGAGKKPGFERDAELAALLLALAIRSGNAEVRYSEALARLGEAQEWIDRTEKLMALVDMASSLAHEIKNPLVSIGGYAAKLKRHIETGSDALPYVEQMLHEVKRVERLIDGIMRFFGDGGSARRPDDVNDILKSAVKFFEDDFRAGNIKLVMDLYHGALPVNADREQLTIAFDNLIANAIQSMKNGGTLTLTTGVCAGSVSVRVSDSGGGIDPANIGNIFNPFFTTKKNGTGLGLPIANSIMHRHSGAIEVENEEGVGVTFVLKLPLAG
jgi:signal transduction histidine kinase